MNMPGLVPWLFDSGIPYLLVCQSNRAYALPSFQMRRDIQGLFRNAFKICFVAEENARAAARFLAMDLPNAAVVQNPVNLRDTGIVPWSGDTKFRLACVARFEIRDKGQDLLLEALSRPAWKERDFELSFFGNGPDGEIIQDLIGHYGLGEKVRVAGFEPDIRKVWAAHQMLVLPSLSEGTPLSLIEAQVCGRPALVTRVDGNPDWVEEGKTGFLAEAPTVYHLRAALDRAWDKRYFWHEMGKAARDVCMAKRDPDHAGTLLKMLDMAASRTKTES
jgi:glycosyltransferase involved in cell wall biosynthesis